MPHHLSRNRRNPSESSSYPCERQVQIAWLVERTRRMVPTNEGVMNVEKSEPRHTGREVQLLVDLGVAYHQVVASRQNAGDNDGGTGEYLMHLLHHGQHAMQSIASSRHSVCDVPSAPKPALSGGSPSAACNSSNPRDGIPESNLAECLSSLILALGPCHAASPHRLAPSSQRQSGRSRSWQRELTKRSPAGIAASRNVLLVWGFVARGQRCIGTNSTMG